MKSYIWKSYPLWMSLLGLVITSAPAHAIETELSSPTEPTDPAESPASSLAEQPISIEAFRRSGSTQASDLQSLSTTSRSLRLPKTIESPPASTLSPGASNPIEQAMEQPSVPSIANPTSVPLSATHPSNDGSQGSIATPQFHTPPIAQSPTAPALKTNRRASTDRDPKTMSSDEIAQPVRIELIPTSDSRVPADGRSRVSFLGQIFDAAGQPIHQDAIVTLTSTAGKFLGADYDLDLAGFQVFARNGQFSAELQSNLTPQKVKIRAGLDRVIRPKPDASLPAAGFGSTDSTPVEVYTQVEFITNLRPSLVSGALTLRIGAAGTDYYSSFRDFLRDDLNGTAVDAKATAFAIGAVGDWLFTGAYNSDRPLNRTCSGTTSLFRADQFCDQTYPVYGDSSTVDYLTPSIDSVYLKFERTSPVPNAGSDYFMWGDYKTEEFAHPSQLFTATNRSLHGFKGHYNLGNLQAVLMYGNNLQGFQRDTIVPDGTSGYYFLSRRLVLAGSETVAIETEELNRPGTVLDRVNLSRGRDYEVDYDRGALLFRKPVLATDFDLFGRTLVRRIVVTYQYDNNSNNTQLYAGRLQYNFSRETDRESWIAGSYLREDLGGQDFELYGADALVSFGKDSRLIAEYAQSHNNSPFGYVSGNAYRIEASAKVSPAVATRAYYRSVDEGFANNATFSFAPGQTRYGAEFAAKITTTTQFQAQFDREINYGIATEVRSTFEALFNPGVQAPPGSAVNNALTTMSAGVTQKLGTAALSLNWVNRTRTDRIANQLTEDSNQLVSRFTYPIAENLLFRAQNELSLGSSTDPLYPNRTTVGLDWNAFPGVTMRVAQQFLSGSNFGSKSLTTFETLVDRKISEDTTLTGRYSILNGINGWSSQSAIGLQHQFKLSPGLRVNVGYERISGDLLTYTGAGQQYAQPYAVGQSAASLGLASGDSYSIGFEYTDNPNFKASGRFEKRNSSEGNNMVISAAAVGKVSPAITLLARFQQANYANQTIAGLGDTKNLKVGFAYRDPNDDRFNLLLGYEFRENPDLSPDSLLFGEGSGSRVHLLNLEALYAPNFRWEFYGKFALRSTKSFLAKDYVGSNMTTLSQFRVGYKLGYNWDLVSEVRWIHQTTSGADELGSLFEVGYYLTPNLRMAAGYSLGRTDDIDFNGSRSRGGPYVAVALKLNDLFGFGRQRIAPKQQQESVISNAMTVKPATEKTTSSATPSPIPRIAAMTSLPINALNRMERILAGGAL